MRTQHEQRQALGAPPSQARPPCKGGRWHGMGTSAAGTYCRSRGGLTKAYGVPGAGACWSGPELSCLPGQQASPFIDGTPPFRSALPPPPCLPSHSTSWLLPPALPSSLLSVFSVSSLQCHDVLGGSWGPGAKVSKSKKWAGNDTFN